MGEIRLIGWGRRRGNRGTGGERERNYKEYKMRKSRIK
jgi:hypothetical protein